MQIAQVLYSGADKKLVLVFLFDPIDGKIKKVQRLKSIPIGMPSHRIRRREYHGLVRDHLPRKKMNKEERKEAHRKAVSEYRKRKANEITG